MIELTLYSGPDCALCEEAKELIFATLDYGAYRLEIVDVTQSLETKKNYGLRIPVLKKKHADQELAWPFDEQNLRQFISS